VLRNPAADARIVAVNRPQLNELAAEGRLAEWAEAYEHGHVRVSGDAAVTKLLGECDPAPAGSRRALTGIRKSADVGWVPGARGTVLSCAPV
jgi:hypothetical protein